MEGICEELTRYIFHQGNEVSLSRSPSYNYKNKSTETPNLLYSVVHSKILEAQREFEVQSYGVRIRVYDPSSKNSVVKVCRSFPKVVNELMIKLSEIPLFCCVLSFSSDCVKDDSL